MKARRIKAIAKKELIQVWRDPRSLMIALLMPLMQMALLGYGVNLDIEHIPVCTFDREASQQSRSLAEALPGVDLFQHRRGGRLLSAPLTDALDYGRCKIGVVIPPDFSERLVDLGTVPVQVILDATDDNTANIGLGYAQDVVSGFSGDIQARTSQRQGAIPQNARRRAAIPSVVQRRSEQPQFRHSRRRSRWCWRWSERS